MKMVYNIPSHNGGKHKRSVSHWSEHIVSFGRYLYWQQSEYFSAFHLFIVRNYVRRPEAPPHLNSFQLKELELYQRINLQNLDFPNKFWTNTKINLNNLFTSSHIENVFLKTVVVKFSFWYTNQPKIGYPGYFLACKCVFVSLITSYMKNYFTENTPGNWFDTVKFRWH